MENYRVHNDNVEKVHVCGDVHANFSYFFAQLKLEEYHNSAIIVAGDCGLGFNKPTYYIDLFQVWNKKLKENNIHVYFIRGNHDDPSYFDGKQIHYSNIQAVPDYTILTFTFPEYEENVNILCVGGGISIDRLYRIETDTQFNQMLASYGANSFKYTYWADEVPVYKEELIPIDIPIHIVVSHIAPSFVYPHTKDGIGTWLLKDEQLDMDTTKEREVLDQIYSKVKDTVKWWYYGHYHSHSVQDYKNTTFVLCDCLTLTKIIPTDYEELGTT